MSMNTSAKFVIIFVCFLKEFWESCSLPTSRTLSSDVTNDVTNDVTILKTLMKQDSATSTTLKLTKEETAVDKSGIMLHYTTMSSKDELIIQDTTMPSKDELIIQDTTKSSKDDLIFQDTTMSSTDDIIIQGKIMSSKDDLMIQDTTLSSADDLIIQGKIMSSKDDLIIHDKIMLSKDDLKYQDTTISPIENVIILNTTMASTEDLINPDKTMFSKDDLIIQVTTMSTPDDIIDKDTVEVTSVDLLVPNTALATLNDPLTKGTSHTSVDRIVQDQAMLKPRNQWNPEKTTPYNTGSVKPTSYKPMNQNTEMSKSDDHLKQETTTTAFQDVIKQETATTAFQDAIKQETAITTFHDKHITTTALKETKNLKRARLTTIEATDDKTRLSKSLDKNEEIRESNTTPETQERGQIESCKDRCGDDISIPCSCSAKCVVYRNCCEDIQDNCLPIYQLGEREFSDLLDLETECTSDEYLVISGCHQNAQVNVSSFSILDNDTSNNVGPHKGIVNDILSKIHVTDRSTGVTFKNIHVFNCNKREHSFPLKWSAYFNDLDFWNNRQSVIEKKDELFTYSFSPPSDLPSASPRCIQNSIRNCKSGLLGSSNDEKLCPTITSYVTTEGVLKKYFNNKYCAECNGYHGAVPVSMGTVKDKHNFYFSIIGSFRDDNIIFSALPGTASLWSKLQCSVRENNSLTTFPDHYRCDIVSCSAGFHKRADGECKQLHVLRLGLTIGTLNFKERQYLSQILRCLLSAYTEFEAVGEWLSFLNHYDRRLQKEILFVEIAVYVPDRMIIKLKEQSLIIHYKTVLTIVRKIKNLFLLWPYNHIAVVDHLPEITSVDIKINDRNEPHMMEVNTTVNQSKMIACVCISLFSEVKMTKEAPCIPECVHFHDYDTVGFNEDGSDNSQSTSDNCLPQARSKAAMYRVSIQYLINFSFFHSYMFLLIVGIVD